MEDAGDKPEAMNTAGGGDDTLRSTMGKQPCNFIFKLEGYTLLLNTGRKEVESGHFEAAGQQWKLVLYPEGDAKNKGSGFISLYLRIVKPPLFDVDVSFRLFLQNKKKGDYMAVQRSSCRFNETQMEHGCTKLLALSTFKDPTNGYLVEDCCSFGADVVLLNPSYKVESLSMISMPQNNTHTWIIDNFSVQKRVAELSAIQLSSSSFVVGDQCWELCLNSYCTNISFPKYRSISLNVISACGIRNLYAKFILRIKNPSGHVIDKYEGERWFDSLTSQCIMNLDSLEKNRSKYVEDDKLIVEIEFLMVSKLASFSTPLPITTPV